MSDRREPTPHEKLAAIVHQALDDAEAGSLSAREWLEADPSGWVDTMGASGGVATRLDEWARRDERRQKYARWIRGERYGRACTVPACPMA